MKLDTHNITRLAAAVRTLSIDAVQKANSGHPGLPLGAADFTSVLWANYLRCNPKDPAWINRDRFVLSAGHGCMLLYSMLNLFGYDLPMSQLEQFRQWESITPGHPEYGITPGVECTTGPLGQGAANSVGLALSGKMLAARYGEDVFNYKVYALVSDGDLMEGVAAEAGSLAGHLKLDNLVYLYDDNKISLAGETEICFTESVAQRYEAYGWFVQSCDGHNPSEVSACLDRALAQKGKPSLICCKTILGYGSPNKKNTHEAHGAPLGADEVKATKKNLGVAEDTQFYVPDDVKGFIAGQLDQKQQGYAAWQSVYAAWRKAQPELAKQLDMQLTREIPLALKEELLGAFKEPKKDATRNLSGKAIQVIAKHIPGFVGGSADLDPSTKTAINGGGRVGHEGYGGKNIHFGVREHAMGSMANGLAYTQAWIPYTATFLVFSDYMRPAMRVGAISHLQSLYIFTHDSFWVGEDGPTHEPIEHIMSLRVIPNLHVYRPADGIEVAMCYYAALQRKKGPSSLIFSRQNLAPIARPSTFNPDDVLKGGYVVVDCDNPAIVVVATGSEVATAVEAAALLNKSDGVAIRVVSMPCVEAFKAQPADYQQQLLPNGIKIAVVEAGTTIGWSSLLNRELLAIGIDHYGASAPGEVLAEKFGFTPKAVAERLKRWA
ncbi:MAG: transketolase [Pseudomonadota bacterium]|jgi:transketolase